MLKVDPLSIDQRQSDVNNVVGNKHDRVVESSFVLWHKRLGHFSKERMERLIKENILHDLDFSDFETCIDCVKGKLTARVRKNKVNRSEGILQLVHFDICGPITPVALGGFRHFTIFIDDFSRYGLVELLREKSESLDAFKTFKATIKLKFSTRTKCLKSNRGGEFYDKYD